MKVLKEKIIAVIEAEQKLIGGWLVEMEDDLGTNGDFVPVCDSPGHCAIGALLVAAGFSDADTAGLGGNPEFWHAESRAATTLAGEYGLTRMLAQGIAECNDDTPDPLRRVAVIDTVRAMPDEIEAELARVLPTTEERTNE